jgi:hypothetical protein
VARGRRLRTRLRDAAAARRARGGARAGPGHGSTPIRLRAARAAGGPPELSGARAPKLPPPCPPRIIRSTCPQPPRSTTRASASTRSTPPRCPARAGFPGHDPDTATRASGPPATRRGTHLE